MTKIVCLGLLGLSFAFNAMDRTAAKVIQFGQRQKETVQKKYKEVYGDQVKKEVARIVSNAVIESNCYSEVTNKVLLTGGQGLSSHNAEMDEFGPIYGKKMNEKKGNVFTAFPDAVEEYCFKSHMTDTAMHAATSIADGKARHSASLDVKKVFFPKSTIEIGKVKSNSVALKTPISSIE